MDTNTFCFGSHGITASVDEGGIPSRCHMNTRGEYSHTLNVSKAVEISLVIGMGLKYA